jgi:hypothetical protein
MDDAPMIAPRIRIPKGDQYVEPLPDFYIHRSTSRYVCNMLYLYQVGGNHGKKEINSNNQQPESVTLNSRKPIQGYQFFVGLVDHDCGTLSKV